MSHDDRDAIPEPDLPATDSEKHRARAFGDLMDDMLAGEAPPPAVEANQRDLLEMATSLRAQIGHMPLADDRRDDLIDSAFRAAVGAPATQSVDAGAAEAASMSDWRARSRKVIPWVGMVAAAAAAAVLLLTRPAPRTHTVETVVERPVLSIQHLSRPSDALIGKIDPARAGDATSRIDMIYADRLAGYRDLRLRGLAKGAPK